VGEWIAATVAETFILSPLCEINERVALSQSALSQHLAILREAGIVTTTRESQSVRYSLPPGAVTKVMEVLYEEFCRR
jgi:DNA-binding transcriptional ArsR family regulator